LESTKYLSPFMNFFASQTLGRVNRLRRSEVIGQTLPLFVGAPIGVGRAHFLFEEAANELRNRGVFVGGFTAGPVGDLGIEGDGDVL
jgi:hypothetical protein